MLQASLMSQFFAFIGEIMFGSKKPAPPETTVTPEQAAAAPEAAPEAPPAAESEEAAPAGREAELEAELAKVKDQLLRTLAEALVGADMFLGLSVAGACKQDMIRQMRPNPIIFPMANPTPEIMPEEILAVRPDASSAQAAAIIPTRSTTSWDFLSSFAGRWMCMRPPSTRK